MINKYYDLLKPKILINLSNKFMSLLMMISLILVISSLYFGIYAGETDYQQGENFKIIYIHVTGAWLSLGFYGLLALFSLIYLINKHLLIYLMGKISASLGINFSLITLITGSLWGRPTWGTFWVWDARLTSVLILFFLYLGYLILDKTHEIRTKAMTNSSILALIGFINLPIIKYSVQWWNTLHQSSSVTSNYITLDSYVFNSLLIFFLGILTYSSCIFLLEIRKYLIKRKIETYYL
jgi:heme exporter protein C